MKKTNVAAASGFVLCFLAIVFGVAVVAAYVIQPDYTYSNAVDYWKNLGEWGSLFN